MAGPNNEYLLKLKLDQDYIYNLVRCYEIYKALNNRIMCYAYG